MCSCPHPLLHQLIPLHINSNVSFSQNSSTTRIKLSPQLGFHLFISTIYTYIHSRVSPPLVLFISLIMNRRGGCCIARYAGGSGAYEEKKLMDRAMLKFRPIAPKPTTGASSTFDSSSSDIKTSSGETTYVTATGREKRKYNIVNKATKTNSNRAPRKRVRATLPARSVESSGVVVTLPLLPESPTNQQNCKTSTSSSALAPAHICWLSFNNSEQIKKSVESIVTIECVSVTDTCLSESSEWLGTTDEERLTMLECDTCPGFITDAKRRVEWINNAYKNMLRVYDDHHQLVVVRVENVKDDYMSLGLQAFTCRVRVQNSSTKEVKILPCDVWRMNCGGHAWRLDVNAALSLGR